VPFADLVIDCHNQTLLGAFCAEALG